MEKGVTPFYDGAVQSASCIGRLPTELLQHSLNLSVAEIRQGHEPWHVYARIAELRLVCTRWMAAIDSYPSLWTLLTNRLSPLLVSVVLQKSGTLPLDIDLSCMAHSETSPPLHYLNTAPRLAGRWRSLNIRWFLEDREDEGLQNFLHTPAPQLKALTIDTFSGVPSRINLFDNVAPNLDSITIRHAMPNWSSFVMRGLKRLLVATVMAKTRDFENIVQVLAASPNMRELQIRGWLPKRSDLLEKPRVAPKPVALDFLQSLTLRVVPSSWANVLLEVIRLPRHCSLDILLEIPLTQGPISEPLKHLRARIVGSPLMKVVLDVRERFLSIGLRCEGTDEVGEASVEFRNPTATAFHPSDALQLWQRSLAEISQEVQTSGVTVHITMSTGVFRNPDSFDVNHFLESALKLVDEHLPSVYKASIAGPNIQQIFEYMTSQTFPNLSDLEVLEADSISWE
ncbi:hypothetical protein FRC01_011737, partial [Tulasnella sp. 417]